MYDLSFVLSFKFGCDSFDSAPCKVRLQMCGALINSCSVSLFFVCYVWLNVSKCDSILCNGARSLAYKMLKVGCH